MNPTEPFAFLDLPAEIRNRIYSIYMADSERKTKHTFSGYPNAFSCHLSKPPAIIRASRQLRIESTPVLFAESTFVVNVGLNLSDRDRAPRSEPPTVICGGKWRQRRAGKVVIDERVKSLVHQCETRAIFKDVKLRICDILPGGPLPLGMDDCIGVLHLQFGGKGLAVQLENPIGRRIDEVTVSKITMRTNLVPEVMELIEAAKTLTTQTAARDDFKGFKLSDLESIAQAFRFN